MATGVPLKKNVSKNYSFSIEYNNKLDEDEVLAIKASKLEKALEIKRDNKDNKWINKLIWGENLNALLALCKDDTVRGKVRLVYIDPPYGTNSVFLCREQKEAYTDNLEGAQFIEFIRERLIVLRELLADDGSIYVHLDEKMIFPIKLVMDEVFGSKNYRNFITRQKCNRKNATRNKYGNISDYILFYTKSDKYVWNRAYEPWGEEDIIKQYPCIDEVTGKRYKKVPIHAPGTRNGETGGEWRGMLPPTGKHWQYLPRKLDEFDAKGEIYWSATGNPRRKIYFENSEGIPVQDIWLDTKDIINQNDKITGYPTEKHISLLDRVVKASSNVGDIVLDCFCGSGTTIVSAESYGRRWIGIDAGEYSIDTIIKRFARGSKSMGDFVNKNQQLEICTERVLKTSMEILVSNENANETTKKIKEWNEMFKAD